MYWKFLPSTGIPEDEPQLSCGRLWSYPQRVPADSVATGRIYKANPLEHGVTGSARMTVSDEDLNLKVTFAIDFCNAFRMSAYFSPCSTLQGLVWSISAWYYSPHLFSSSEPIQGRRNKIMLLFVVVVVFIPLQKKKCLFSIMNKRFQSAILGECRTATAEWLSYHHIWKPFHLFSLGAKHNFKPLFCDNCY